MIKLKLNPLDNKLKDIPYIEGEKISELVERISTELKIPEDVEEDLFSVHVNGEKLDKDFYDYVRPKEDTVVVVTVDPKGGSFGQVFKQVAIIAVIAAATYITGGMASAGTISAFGAVAINTAAALGATLIMNALIPPPNPSMSGPVGMSGQPESQAYSVTSQSNSVSKYGVVPRVYGTHRIFPTVAANPYINIEINSAGKQEQYFYAIYDFGYGPLNLTEIKIGDTLLDNYENVQYNLVDINKPAVSEGDWDNLHIDTFNLYKGDVNIEQLAFGLNTDGSEAIATSSLNPNEYEQQIELFFVAPQGLIGYDTAGGSSTRTVEFRIEIADEGTGNWKAYSDPSAVYGGIDVSQIGDVYLNVELSGMIYSSAKDIPYSAYEGNSGLKAFANSKAPLIGKLREFYIYPATKVFSSKTPLNIGTEFYKGSTYLGKIDQDQSHLLPVGSPYPYAYRLDNSGESFTIMDIGGEFYENEGDKFPLEQEYYYEEFLDVRTNGNNGYITGGRSGTELFRMAANQASPYYGQVVIKPISKKPQDIRIYRVRTYGASSFSTFDNITWSSLQTRLDTEPIKTKNRHTFLEIKIKASEQLNGTIQNLSANASSVLDVYNGTEWVKQATSNPAWVFVDILTGQLNKRALSKDTLDLESIQEWALHCDEVPTSYDIEKPYAFPRFETNLVVDYSITVRDLLNQICGASNASINLYNGKYGVLMDKEKTIPAQLITTRNSRSFRSVKTFAEESDALIIKYVDPVNDWQVNTVRVYKDGQTFETATKFEEFDTFGVTNVEQAFRFGRYLQAQGRLRQETVTILMDFEHLIANRGDLILFQQDVMKMGGQPVRIKAVDGNRITINDTFVNTGNPLGYTYRGADGDIHTDTLTLVNSTQADVDGEIPEAGDLLVWGEIDKITTEWIIRSISPNEDLSANINLVEYNPAIYTSESDEFIADYDPNLSGNIDSEVGAPDLVTDLTIVNTDWDCAGSSYVYFIDLSWVAPNDVYEVFEVYQSIDGNTYDLYTVTKDYSQRVLVAESNLNLDHSFKVLAVASSGAKKPLAEADIVSTVPVGKTALPSNVSDLYLNVTTETIQVNWDLLEDCDIQDYLIRYTPLPLEEAAWDKSSPLETVGPETSFTFAQARTGTYLIKARDWRGVESADAALAFTSIPNLFNLNAIDIIEDDPFDGTFNNCELFGDSIILKDKVAVIPSEYEEEGFYYFSKFLDLGEVYTVRLQAELVAGSFNKSDLMVNWATLADITQLASGTGADYQVDLEYRARDSFNVIAEWNSLADVVDMAGGETGDWTPWRRVTSGDFTGRIFQFRIRLRSYNPTISPQIFLAKVIADMPDRTTRDENINCPVNGVRVNFDPEFKGPAKPNVQITQDAAQSGDYFQLTNVDVTGFDIEFFDSGDTSVQRQFDYAALGYGEKTIATI